MLFSLDLFICTLKFFCAQLLSNKDGFASDNHSWLVIVKSFFLGGFNFVLICKIPTLQIKNLAKIFAGRAVWTGWNWTREKKAREITWKSSLTVSYKGNFVCHCIHVVLTGIRDLYKIRYLLFNLHFQYHATFKLFSFPGLDPVFTKRGAISIKSVQTKKATFTQAAPLSSDDRKLLKVNENEKQNKYKLAVQCSRNQRNTLKDFIH